MLYEPCHVPFTVSDLHHGFAEGHGFVHFDGVFLSLEFQVRDALVGFLKSGVKTLALAWEDVLSVEFQKGWFSSELVFRFTRMGVLKDLTNQAPTELRLAIARQDKTLAGNLAAQVKLKLSEVQLRRLDSSASTAEA